MIEEKKATILIVEDEPIIRKVYSEGLRSEGYTVFIGVNGRDGLEIALREKPDIILLDILMPVMDGLSMMSELRAKNLYGKNVPIILLTNLSASEEKIMKAIVKNEPAYYIMKSDSSLAQLVEKIKERLSRKA